MLILEILQSFIFFRVTVPLLFDLMQFAPRSMCGVGQSVLHHQGVRDEISALTESIPQSGDIPHSYYLLAS